MRAGSAVHASAQSARGRRVGRAHRAPRAPVRGHGSPIPVWQLGAASHGPNDPTGDTRMLPQSVRVSHLSTLHTCLSPSLS